MRSSATGFPKTNLRTAQGNPLLPPRGLSPRKFGPPSSFCLTLQFCPDPVVKFVRCHKIYLPAAFASSQVIRGRERLPVLSFWRKEVGLRVSGPYELSRQRGQSSSRGSRFPESAYSNS